MHARGLKGEDHRTFKTSIIASIERGDRGYELTRYSRHVEVPIQVVAKLPPVSKYVAWSF